MAKKHVSAICKLHFLFGPKAPGFQWTNKQEKTFKIFCFFMTQSIDFHTQLR